MKAIFLLRAPLSALIVWCGVCNFVSGQSNFSVLQHLSFSGWTTPIRLSACWHLNTPLLQPCFTRFVHSNLNTQSESSVWYSVLATQSALFSRQGRGGNTTGCFHLFIRRFLGFTLTWAHHSFITGLVSEPIGKSKNKAQSHFSWNEWLCVDENAQKNTLTQGYRERSCLSLPVVAACRSDLVFKLQPLLHVNHPATSCSAFK